MDANHNVDMIEAIRFDGLNIPGRVPPPPLVANTKNLRWIEWKGDLAGPLLTKFPPMKLCFLKLHASNQKQLWEGYKNLPNLKILVLVDMPYLIQTPNFHGIRNLKRFEIYGQNWKLKEIDSSIGSLEKLDCLRIEGCLRLTMFPSISRLKNLETLSLQGCESMFFLSKIQQISVGTEVKNPGEDLVYEDECDLEEEVDFADVDESDLEEEDLVDVGECRHFEECYLAHYNMKHMPLRVSSSLQQLTGLRTLNLRSCGLGNKNIGSDIWELPNLQELDLSFNKFSCLDFSRLRLRQLKLLNVSGCYELVSLSNLPSSIAVIEAQYCESLGTFGEISGCNWLWKVSLYRGYKLDLEDADKLLRHMLQGNAIEDYFINVSLPHQLPLGFVGSFFRGKSFRKGLPGDSLGPMYMANETYTLRLPDDWYNDFCGFLMRVVTKDSSIQISIKQGPDEEDSRFELWQESPEPRYDGKMYTYVGYVSFGLLTRTTSLNSSFNIISFVLDNSCSLFAAELVPMYNKDDQMQTTDCSNFWDDCPRGFKIHDSKSCINILWTISN